MLERSQTSGRRAGVIIVSSVAGLGPLRDSVTYGAAKAFLLQFGRGLAKQLAGKPIDVMVLLPTFTRTEFFSKAGLPEPPQAMPPEAVASEALGALGRYEVYFPGRRSQTVAWVLARNHDLLAWKRLTRFVAPR